LAADSDDNPFRQALERYCGGRADEGTLALLRAGAGTSPRHRLDGSVGSLGGLRIERSQRGAGHRIRRGPAAEASDAGAAACDGLGRAVAEGSGPWPISWPRWPTPSPPSLSTTSGGATP